MVAKIGILSTKTEKMSFIHKIGNLSIFIMVDENEVIFWETRLLSGNQNMVNEAADLWALYIYHLATTGHDKALILGLTLSAFKGDLR